jgi:hypothetical protein
METFSFDSLDSDLEFGTAKPSVDRTESEKNDAHAELVGSTKHVAISEVLKTICQRELSGDLQVVSGRAKRTLYFDRGFVVFAGSNLKRDRLGQRIIDSGRISQEELDEAFRETTGKKRIGEVLIAEGFLTEDELGREVARQAKQIALSTFVSKDAVYSFDERRCMIPMELRLGLSVYRIQLEGIRHMSNGQLIHKALGSFDRAVRTVEVPPFSFKESELKPVERKVLERAAETSRLRDIIEVLDEDKEEVMRAAYGLLCANILEYEDAEPSERKVQVETEAFLLSSLERTRIAAPTNVRQEVLLRFDDLTSASPGELLDIDEDADEEAIESAYRKQQKEWEKKQALVSYEKSLFIKVEEIRKRLTEAHSRILEDKKKAESEEATAAAAEEDEIEIPIEDEIDIPLEDSADVPIVVEDEDGAAAGSETSGTDSATEALLEEDIVILSSSDTDLPSIEYEEPDDEIIEDKPEPIAPAVPEVPAEKQPTSGESVGDQLKRLLYDIKIRKAVNDKEGVISLLYEVVALMPQSAKYEALLAEALASHSVLSKKAERHFRRALSLEPQSADLHFRMGRYYQSFNMKSRAVAEFKTTLRIDPRHSKARGALVELNESSDKPAGQLFKKIFG